MINNISDGGMMVSGLPADIVPSTTVSVSISGVSSPMTAIVLASGRGRLHGKFELAPNIKEQWQREYERLIVGLQPLQEAA